MADRYNTQKVFSMAWPHWDEITGKPDLSPSHVNALLRNERAALEYAANTMLSKDEEEFDVEQPMDDLIDAAFNDMNQDALKLLNKVFKLVSDEFYTLEFVHPEHKFPVFRAYAYPVLGLKLIALYTVHIQEISRNISNQKAAVASAKAREELEKVAETPALTVNENADVLLENGCTVMPPDFNIPICSCVVDGSSKCKYWEKPEDATCMCKYQTANEEAQGADDLVACLCEDAVSELERKLEGEEQAKTTATPPPAKAGGAKRGRKPKAAK